MIARVTDAEKVDLARDGAGSRARLEPCLAEFVRIQCLAEFR